MTDRARVHELARQLGVPVKDVLARLNGQGVMVRSGSSTVTRQVERWLRDSYGLRDEDKPKSVAAVEEPPHAPVETPQQRKRRGKPRKQRNVTRWGIPQASKEQNADKPERRNRAADPEKVRKRVAELLGTPEGARPKTPAKKTSNKVRRSRAAGSGAQPKKRSSTPAGPTTWKCPNCLKRIDVEKGTALVQHLNARGQRCRGSGFQLPQKSADALDYRVAGSFEGGRRRR